MFHVMISSFRRMSSRCYLPLRHDALPRYVYEQHRIKLIPGCKVEYPSVEFIHSEGNIEYWWNLSIKTAIETTNDKPDVIIWNSKVKTCQVIENLVAPHTSVLSIKFLKKRIYVGIQSAARICFRQIKNLSSFLLL